MNDFFDRAFAYLLQDESTKYVNDPRDPGGATKFGITQKSLENYLGRLVTTQEIKDLSEDVAKQFYFDTYWTPLACAHLTKIGISVCIFDNAVLYGATTAAILAQKAASICGATIKFDGILGDMSVKVLNLTKQSDFIKAFHGLILLRIDALIVKNPTLEVYRDGWTNRANRLLTLNNLVP